MTSSLMAAARCQHLVGLLAQFPDPRKKRGRRHALAGLLAVGIAAVIAGSKSFAAIGQWAGDAGPGVLAALGAERGQAEEFTYRRAFALVSADVLDRVLGAWLHTRAVRAGGRVVIAIDGKTVRGAKSRAGKPPTWLPWARTRTGGSWQYSAWSPLMGPGTRNRPDSRPDTRSRARAAGPWPMARGTPGSVLERGGFRQDMVPARQSMLAIDYKLK
jgi:hypothetical protein